jgi:putative oxygen-independent coproporphyrinogen III oxidase
MKKTHSATGTDGSGACSTTTTKSGSLYIHVPFCRKKCPYCHFYVTDDKEPLKDQLLTALHQEWTLRSPLIDPIETVYFGGGTPALFGPDRIVEVLSWLPPGATEITLEANPEDVTLELLTAYRRAGINRLSLGVQTLNDTLLKRIGRTHSAAGAIDAVHTARAAGFDNITIDLMLELPGQTLAQLDHTLDQIETLPIDHLSLYNLVLEPPSAFYRRPPKNLPDEETGLAMLELTTTRLTTMGLSRYEISAFARPGKQAQHNTGYWTGRPFLGLGPSAFSYWDDQRFRNIANLQRYCTLLSTGTDPIDFRETLAPDARARELFAIGLRLLTGTALPPPVDLTPLLVDGLLEQTPTHTRLTPRGRLFYDHIASHLI